MWAGQDGHTSPGEWWVRRNPSGMEGWLDNQCGGFWLTDLAGFLANVRKCREEYRRPKVQVYLRRILRSLSIVGPEENLLPDRSELGLRKIADGPETTL